MLTEVEKHIKLILLYFKYNLLCAMEYRISFIVQTLAMALNNSFFIFFWWIVFNKVPNLGSYGFKDVMIIWALSASTFGLVHIFFGNVRKLSKIIINGELDTYLLQPKNVYINVHCSRMEVSAWGDLVYGYILACVIFKMDLMKILLFTLFIILGGLLFGSVLASADTFTFFMGDSSALTRLITEFVLNFSLYPDSIFIKQVRWIIYTLIPTGFMIFIPYRLLNAFSFKGLAVLICVDIVYITAAYLFFNKGLKKYESGNLITTKL